MSQEIDIKGVPAQIVEPGPEGRVGEGHFTNKPYARVHVRGINKADGTPIRFKSIKSATNYMMARGIVQ